MQYVGRFVSSVYNTITPNINPATLSGAIDVIVVEREVEVDEEISGDEHNTTKIGSSASSILAPDRPKRTRKVKRTELASTPFHVRFGKMSVLRPGERKVTLHLNNSTEPLPFAMKVGEQGEAFFVVEIDDAEGRDNIPDDLVTSPILSPTTSPGLAPTYDTKHDQPAASASASASAEVEPFDLGEAQTETPSDARSAATVTTKSMDTDDDTVITTPPQSRSTSADSTRQTQSSSQNDQPSAADLDSGPSSSTGILGQLGNAASKAGGAIGAAGRAVGVKADNPRLDKLADRAAHDDPIDQQTGAPTDDTPDAHRYHPQQHNPPGKQRQQAAQDEEPTPPLSEAEKLEKHMQEHAEDLLHQEQQALDRYRQSRQSSPRQRDISPSPSAGSASEEAYPAPFGGSATQKGHSKAPHTNTFPVAQSDHGEFIGGHKLVGLEEKQSLPFNAASMDPRTIQSRIQAINAGEDSALPEPVAFASHGMLRSGSKPDEEKEVPDGDVAQKPPQRKEDLQYMLDMDGYKMTADGEDLAFAEGHRLAEEMPLSRRHGGNEIHPHIGELLDQAHRRERAGLAHVADQPRPQATQDDSSVHSPRQNLAADTSSDAHDDLLTVDPASHAFSARSSRVQQEDVVLGRDLARAARLLRPHGDNDGESSEEGAATASGSSQRRTNRVRHRLQDLSLSDTEADFPGDADEEEDQSRDDSWTARKTHTRAKSGPFDYSSGSRDDDDGDDSELGSASSNHPPRGEPGSRQRVKSHSAGDGLTGASSMDQLPTSARKGTSLPRFAGSETDAYTFLFISEEGHRHSFEMSLCYKDGFGTGHVSDDDPSEEEDFEDSRISFQRFVDDPDVVNDERLVILYKERYLTWENASTILATLSLYRHTFASARGEDDASKAPQAPTPGGPRGSVWSRWWYRNRDTSTASPPDERPALPREASAPPEEPSRLTAPHTIERAQSDSHLLEGGALSHPADGAPQADSAPPKAPKPSDNNKSNKTYAKTLRLTSDQLKSLNLKKGANTITFSVTSSYSGVATCTARIFLWESTHHIVVSDIDGTITKSDALGHVFTMIGRDWTHLGVAKLYTDIARNGYRVMYLTSRAIGQADTTRDYLKGISQNNYRLPDGPVIMSPDRLIASLHREVILRKPEVFKMACLRDIARLFGSDPRKAQSQPGLQPSSGAANEAEKAAEKIDGVAGKEESPSGGAATAAPNNATPFYAGFGNRITDALSYRSVNIPSSRIFTIDTNGEVKMELLELAGYKSSYIHMTDLVDQMFPPITNSTSEKKTGKPEYNDFNFWRPQISSAFELPSDDDLMPSPPVSPALSARSGRSVRSQGSVRSSNTESEQQQQQQGRLSRFGLGSLGLSRKGSAATVANDSSEAKGGKNEGPQHSHTIAGDSEAAAAGILPSTSSESHLPLGHVDSSPHRANSAPMEAAADTAPLSSSYGSGTSSWIAPWRRRAVSPSATPNSSHAALSPPQATSPLVGPVISADGDSDEDEEGSGDEDDDVSSFGGEGDSQDEEYDEDEEEDEDEADGQSGTDNGSTSGRRRRRRRREQESSGLGDSVLEDDELLATGEVQFDWRG